MTLVLSCLTHDYAVQVSDKRITAPDGRIYSDIRNKGCSTATKWFLPRVVNWTGERGTTARLVHRLHLHVPISDAVDVTPTAVSQQGHHQPVDPLGGDSRGPAAPGGRDHSRRCSAAGSRSCRPSPCGCAWRRSPCGCGAIDMSGAVSCRWACSRCRAHPSKLIVHGTAVVPLLTAVLFSSLGSLKALPEWMLAIRK